MDFSRKLIYVFLAILLPLRAMSQGSEPQDSLVRLISAESVQLLEINGVSYRKAVGPAKFLHNNTYLLCDTALWNVGSNVIDAIGHVRIIQEQTELRSEKMIYYVNRDLAEFRGQLVQLRDKDGNTLRTRHLDYNTKDSIAVFKDGGSMMDKDGQVIESQRGTYDSKIQTFVFTENVNMFTDSIFVKTVRLKYESEKNLATFGTGTNAWKDDNMLSSHGGWYDRGREVFFFNVNVHVMSDSQEGWCDSLYFYRNTSDVEMLGHAQVTDTVRNVSALAGRIRYSDSVEKVTLTRKPAVVLQTEENGQRDTVYFGADTLMYYTKRKCDIDSLVAVEAAKRVESMNIDPVSEFRKKAAEEAAKAAAEAAANDPNRPPAANRKPTEEKKSEQSGQPSGREKPEQPGGGKNQAAQEGIAAPGDTLQAMSDLPPVADEPVEEPVKDTTKIGFMTALRNVKVFRDNLQVVCDSLEYSDLDSLARLYRQPVIWNEVTQQYSADSIYLVIKNGGMDKASLMSDAFVHMEQDTLHYNQIRGTEMMAYFDKSGALERFDALGGASALFYLEENGTLATVNKKESKMLSAYFKEGNISRIFYFDAALSDGYPIVQMSQDDQRLKGFNWQPKRRPKDRNEITPLELRSPQRAMYAARPMAEFKQTDIYFPGYISDVHRQIAVRDSLAKVREKEREEKERVDGIRERRTADSLAVAARRDSISLAAADKAAKDSIAVADSLATKAVRDSLAHADSSAIAAQIPDKAKLKEMAAEARRQAREKRKADKEARWAALDKADADKARAKEEKKLYKIRQKKLKMLLEAEEQARKDAAVLEKYKEKYKKKLDRKLAREQKKSERRLKAE